MQRVVLASHNAGKLAELTELLAPLGCELLPLSAFSDRVPEESAQSFVENAILKARFAAAVSGLAAIADDSGLMVAALGGDPGVRSARFAGADATDKLRVSTLLRVLGGVPPADRGAEFVCVLVYLRSATDPTPVVGEGIWRGCITTAARGNHGFGYDPVFQDPGTGLTAAELSPAAKSRLSHRAVAAQALVARLVASKNLPTADEVNIPPRT